MFVELFWPKEMKELVRKYRKEGTLNEVAVKCFTKYQLITLILCILLAVLFSSNIFYSLAVVILTPLLIFIESQRLYRKSFQAYKGQLVKVSFNKIRFYFGGSQKIFCHLIEDPKKQIILNLGNKPRIRKEDYPKKDDVMEVFFNEKTPHNSMPNIDYIKENFCLTTSNI